MSAQLIGSSKGPENAFERAAVRSSSIELLSRFMDTLKIFHASQRSQREQKEVDAKSSGPMWEDGLNNITIFLPSILGKAPSEIAPEPLSTANKDKIFAAVNLVGLQLFRNRGLTERELKGVQEFNSVGISPPCFFDLLGMSLCAVPKADQNCYLNILKLNGVKSASNIGNALKAVYLDREDQLIRVARIFATRKGSFPKELQEYGADIFQGEKLAEKINAKVNSLTQEKIPCLFASKIDQMLVSVVHICFNWAKNFYSPKEKFFEFTFHNGQRISMPMVLGKFPIGSLLYSALPKYEVIGFGFITPDKRKLMKMILLPGEGEDLLKLEKEFNPIEALNQGQPAGRVMELRLPLPKSNWSKSNLLPVLEEMGLPCSGIKSQIKELMMRVEVETDAVLSEGPEIPERRKCHPTVTINRSFANYIIDMDLEVILLAEDFIDPQAFKL